MPDIFKPSRTAFITGAAMGIGRAAALACAQEGMNIVAVDLLPDRLGQLEADLLRVTSPEKLLVVAADLGNDGPRAHAFEAAIARFGAPDFVMNNAATRIGQGHDAAISDWRAAFEVNYWAVVESCRFFVTAMKEANGGAIVNVGSKQGITNPPGHPIYNVAKSALKTYTETLEHELRSTPGPAISTHLLIPGWTTTGNAEHRQGAWMPEQVVSMMMEGVRAGDFYILCPDDETTPEQDRKRILWGAGDITENRPPLSRWHADWKDKAAKACS